METRTLRLGTLALLAAACAATPVGPPEEVAPRIATALDAGKSDEAAELFEGAADDGGSEKLYPLLYEEARGRYRGGECARSARLLRFMADRYPRALAVREALVYALFLERAASETPAADVLQELDAAVADLRRQGSAPHWIELVEAQLSIDRGEPARARTHLASFREAWDGQPPELVVYVEDIGRYLDSHP
jgi:hypothetical protein